MFIKNFYDFTNEAYLEGGRAPIYHFTYSHKLPNILADDELKTSKPSRQSHGHDKSISLTRNIDYFEKSGFCFELDADKLRIFGYKIYPVDEWAWKEGKPNLDAIRRFNFCKSNFAEVKSGKRGTKHKLDLPKDPILETEFEERIYKNIKNLGKYILKIYISYDINDKYLKDYLRKYPHIRVYKILNNNIRFGAIDVTDEILKEESVKKIKNRV